MNNSAKIKDRMFRYLEINQISKLKFCEITGISYGNVTGKAQKSEFGGEQITEILLKFPDINPDWLLLEKGEMLRSEVEKKDIIDPLEMVSLKKYEEKVEECALLKAELKVLKEQAARYAETKGAYSGITIDLEN